MNRRGLGKGLDALLDGGLESTRGETLSKIPVVGISPNPYQPRRHFDEEKLAELAGSIKMYGVLQPVVVRRWGEGYQLVTGERRWRASQIAGLAEIPAVLREYSDEEMTAVALVENLQRDDLNPIEEANAYRRLIDEFGFTQEEVSQKVGKSRPFIANTLRLLNLPASVQEKIAAGSLTPGQARPLLVLPTAELQIKASEEIREKALTARESEALARQWVSRPKKAGSKPATVVATNEVSAQEWSERLTRIMGTRVLLVLRPNGAATISIEAFSTEELQRLLELIERLEVTESQAQTPKNKPSELTV